MRFHRGPGRPRHVLWLLAVAIPISGIVLAACTDPGTSPQGSGAPVPSGPPSSSGPSDGPGTSGGTAIAHPTGATDLVIRYEEVGGFVAPQALLTRYPVVSVYGDGRVVTEGPIPAIYPGPAMPNLQVATVTEAGLQRLLGRARDDGLFGPDASYDATNVADASTARFTVVADGVTHRISAYGLGMDDANADPAVAAARAKLRDFAGAVGDLQASVGAEDVGRESGFAWDSLAIWVRPGAPNASDPALVRPPIAWPLSTPLATFGDPAPSADQGARCGTVSGADAATMRSLLDRATEITGWTSDGKTYSLVFHPLLPDQTSCPTGG